MARARGVPPLTRGAPPASDLRADCSRCFGLCCVAPAFAASTDFAIDKAAGAPCPHLQPTFRCDIHDRLRAEGFPGCAAYDCFGAGQKVLQVTFRGEDWRHGRAHAARMFTAFTIMRQLHELLWLLTTALALPEAAALHVDLGRLRADTERLTHGDADSLAALDVAAHRERVNTLLQQASSVVRTSASSAQLDRRGADLMGQDLRGLDLRASNLRGALLVAADLRRNDLTLADLTGADLRAANLAGADLRRGLFLTQSQLDAAHGDGNTRLPPSLTRPAHWSA